MLQVIPLEKGRERLTSEAALRTVCAERAELNRAAGRVLAEDIVAGEDLPAFSRASVDGWAVVAADTFGVSASLPALLRLAGEVKMGEHASFALQPGTCAAVWTGGELPRGADAMVMLEEAETLSGGIVAVETSTVPGRHIVFRGDDTRRGTVVFSKGKRLSPRDIGVLAALGVSKIPVAKRPRVCVLSTGDELVDPSETPVGAQIRDCNGPMLTAACERAGAEVLLCSRVPDDETELLERMRSLAEYCDLLLLSGGSSAGEKDAGVRCLGALGEVFFHGLAVKPGKPVFAGKIGGSLVIGLPGHPAAACLMFCELVLPLLAALQGEIHWQRTLPARLAAAVPSNHGREELVPVLLAGEEANPLISKSGLIAALARADGYIRIPRDTEGLLTGARVDVILF